MNPRLSRLSIPAVLLLWGVLILYFCLSGRIVSYLHPSFQWFAFASGVILTLLAAAVFLLPDGHCCDSHGSHALGLPSLAMLVVPILATTSISQDHFSASTVLNRRVLEHIEDLPAFTPPLDPPLPQHDGTVGEGTMMDPSLYLQTNTEGQILAETVDLMYAATDETMRSDFDGREVEVVGQLMPARTGSPDNNRFHLVRLFVMCCAADARPAGIIVQTNESLNFAEMDWVKVSGTATFPVENGRHKAVLHANRIIETEPPRESFIY
jgi:uncharacterized repeat protein (TIGR03943 family)